MPDSLPHDTISAMLRQSLASHEPGDPPQILGVWRRSDGLAMLPLRKLTALLHAADEVDHPGGEALEAVAAFARVEGPQGLGIPDQSKLITVAFRVEAWNVTHGTDDASWQLANQLANQRRLSEHPNATTVYACYGYCRDGTVHQNSWMTGEAAPTWKYFPADSPDVPQGLVIDSLRGLLNAITGAAFFRRQPPRP